MPGKPQNNNSIFLKKKFGRFTIVNFSKCEKKQAWLWVCKCDCGNERICNPDALKRKEIISCGCYRTESASKRALIKNNFKTHGLSYSPEHRIWSSMKYRCNNKKHRYNQRGIRVCKRWKDFQNFYEDMGPRPSKDYSIGRIDNNGNYSPENCRWETREQQSNNKSNSIFFELNGKKLTLPQWCKEMNLKYKTISKRMYDGLSFKEAIKA